MLFLLNTVHLTVYTKCECRVVVHKAFDRNRVDPSTTMLTQFKLKESVKQSLAVAEKFLLSYLTLQC